ncbi:MAG: hypothetical protein PHF05_03205 [Candidatus Izemoplasmatales bacterium]|nr:hypothetical protein [Candidatus Izemoplasmatales bacterium]
MFRNILKMFIMIIATFIKDSEEVYVYKERSIEYGNIENNNFDGYIRIYEESILVNEVIYDSGGHDFFKYLAIVSDKEFVMVCDVFSDSKDYALPIYQKTMLIKYNINGELLTEKSIDYQPKIYHNHNNCLILRFNEEIEYYDSDLELIDDISVNNVHIGEFHYQYQGEAYINGKMVEEINIKYPGIYKIKLVDGDYSYSFSVIVEPDVLIEGDMVSGFYLGTVKIFSYGELYLNNEVYKIGDSIYNVGNYHLLVLGDNEYRYEKTFTIIPDISVRQEGGLDVFVNNTDFYNPVQFYSNAISILLNDEYYGSEYICETGDYKITFLGINDYRLDLHFRILPSIQGVEDAEVYQEITFNVFGNARLNGELISGNYKITDPGQYKLELLFNGEVYNSIEFKVISGKSDNEVEEDSYLSYLKYIFLFFGLLGGVIILRKK